MPLAVVAMLWLVPGAAVAQSADARAALERGLSLFQAGRIDESVADLDRASELSPETAPYLWQRGIALYYVGRYQDCREQLELHRTVNPNDVENPAWHFLCVAKLESPEAARAALLPVGADQRSPMAEIYEMLRGERTPVEVLEAAGPEPLARFYAYLYIGLYHEALGEMDQAYENMRTAAGDEYSIGRLMHTVARFHADWLEQRR